MSTEAIGAHILLMCVAWQQDIPCSIPNDPQKIQKWTRLSVKKWKKLEKEILAAWRLEADRYYQDGLLKEHEKQEKTSAKRKQAAETRWEKDKQMECKSNANALQMECTHAHASSSSSSLKEKELTNAREDNPSENYQNRFTPKGQDRRKQALDILHHLNEKADRKLPDSYTGVDLIIARLQGVYSPDDLKRIIDTKIHDPYFQKRRNLYTPETLFSDRNIQKYLTESPEDFNGKPGAVKSKQPPSEPAPDIDAYRKHLEDTLPDEQKYFRRIVIDPLKDNVNYRSWRSFINPLLVAEKRDGTLVLYHSDASWINEHYKGAIEAALATGGAKTKRIEITGHVPEEV